jgi:hypothetical protein
MNSHGNRRHGWGKMRVIRGCHENHIQLIGVIFKQLMPIRIAGCTFPAFFLENASPPSTINLSKGNALQLGFV